MWEGGGIISIERKFAVDHQGITCFRACFIKDQFNFKGRTISLGLTIRLPRFILKYFFCIFGKDSSELNTARLILNLPILRLWLHLATFLDNFPLFYFLMDFFSFFSEQFINQVL